jgi:hypothetical protein
LVLKTGKPKTSFIFKIELDKVKMSHLMDEIKFSTKSDSIDLKEFIGFIYRCCWIVNVNNDDNRGADLDLDSNLEILFNSLSNNQQLINKNSIRNLLNNFKILQFQMEDEDEDTMTINFQGNRSFSFCKI